MPTLKHPVVGEVKWQRLPGADGSVRLLDGWAARNLVTVRVPQLVGVATYDGRCNGDVPWYAPAAGQLRAAFAEIERRGLKTHLRFWGGSYCPRLVRGSTRMLSNHAVGTALDLNPQWNPLGGPASTGTGMVLPLVPVFREFGFLWGGDYQRRKDPMHFEIARLVKAEPEAPVRITLNGKETGLPAKLVDGHVYAPARPLAALLGLQIGFDAETKRVLMGHAGGEPAAIETLMVGGMGWVLVANAAALASARTTWDPLGRVLDMATKPPLTGGGLENRR
ncbi:MAG TPA: hypothetical protein GX715_10935 [Armatimonadetes bacterium]|nr:hypothetical protein [Armatimonadota bacterium]